MLGRHEFDNSNRWDQLAIPQDLHEIATQFIPMKKSCSQEETMAGNLDVPTIHYHRNKN